MRLTELALKRPAFMTMIFVALAVLGIFGYSNMGLDFLPKMDWPFVSVVTIYPGAGPREIESLISKPIEEAISGVEKLDNVRSYSYEGYSVVVAQFSFSANTDECTAEVQRRVDQMRSTLPTDAKAPTITKADPNATPILRISLTGDPYPRELYQFTKDKLKPSLEQVDGVSTVAISGGKEREIRVEIDNQKLNSYKLSILQVSQALKLENLDFPTGKIDEKINQFIVRLAGKYKSVEDVGNTVVASTQSGVVYLKDIANVMDTYKENALLSRLNGQNSIGLAIQKQSDANSVKTSDRLRERMAELEKRYETQHIKFTIAQDQTDFTRQSLSDVQRDLFLAILMVAIVLFLFLHSFRNSMIVLLSIPTSLISTFFFAYILGYTINLMSLMALALVIGILVDDSIVVLENIHRHMEKGEGQKEAAINGRSEIGFAAIAITLVDVVVFFPISMVGGLVGRIFSEFGITIVISTLLSLFVSFTLTPLLASRVMKITEIKPGTRMRKIVDALEVWQDNLGKRYHSILSWALDHRKSIIGISAALLIGSIALIPLGFIGTEFLTQADRGEFAVNIDMPLGTTIEKTDEAVREVEKIISSMPEVARYQTTVGKQQTENRNIEQSNLAQIQLKLVEKNRKRSTSEVMTAIMNQTSSIPGLTTSFNVIGIFGSANQKPLQVEIYGSDMDEVVKFSEKVGDIIRTTKGTADVTTSWEEGKPELKIEVDREKAAKLGLTLAEIGMAARTALEGDVATKYKEGDTEYDLRVVLAKENRVRADEVGEITLLNHYGQPVQLKQVANVYVGKGPSQIQRKDRERLVTVSTNLTGEVALGEVTAAVEKTIKSNGIPNGITVFYGGESKNMRDMFRDMLLALSLAVLFVYMIMVSLFESYVHPFTIMFSLPVALVGALGGLALVGTTLSMLTMIGVIMLMGLVTKNAILLVDYTNTLRARGLDMRSALLEAGKTRLRPIIMTTATMVFGMMPLGFGFGAGGEMRRGMAIVVIGGLISSTLLTLVLVPVIYTYVEGLRHKLPVLFKRVAWAANLPWKDRPAAFDIEASAK